VIGKSCFKNKYLVIQKRNEKSSITRITFTREQYGRVEIIKTVMFFHDGTNESHLQFKNNN
jgi:hypothetical protein